MPGRFRTSQQGIDLIKGFEGFRATASRLPDGRWIIGHGHVKSAREGVAVTPRDAEDLLRYDLREVEDALANLVFAPLNQNQFDALASLVFNISPVQFRNSEILRRLNGGDYLGAAAGFEAWRRARINGRVMVIDALVRRRAAEKALFLDNPASRPTAPSPLVVPELDPAAAEAAPVAVVRPVPAQPAAQPANQPAPPTDPAAAARRETEEAITRGLERLQSAPQSPPRPANDRPAPQMPVGGDRATVAARLARILERSEQAVAVTPEPAAQAPQARLRPVAQPIPEDLPDFDAPAQKPAARASAPPVEPPPPPESFETPEAASTIPSPPRPRIFIDDTEIYEPGRPAEALFAEAQTRQRTLTDRFDIRQKPAASDDASWIAGLAPWLALVIVSVLGLGVAVYESIHNTAGAAIQAPFPGASTGLALFGFLLLASLYFLARRALDPNR